MTHIEMQAAVVPVICTLALSLCLATGLFAQQPLGAGAQRAEPAPAGPETAQTPSPNPSKALWANLAWLDGRWQGNWGPRVAEQTWMGPKGGAMVGMFRAVENSKTLVIELFSLLETPDGIEYRFRHFTPALAPWESSGPTVLKVTSADPARIVFENPSDGKPKRVIFTRTGPDTYISRSEITPDEGETQVTEITYHRQPVSGGSAGRR